jgi:acyl-CoA thioester hydrolase
VSHNAPAEGREGYHHFHPIETRWLDNDVYGHVNNVVYYSYFDTAVNHWLITEAGLDVVASDVIGVVAETGCRFHSALAFPDVLEAGLRVAKLGRTSVRWEIGIFRRGDSLAAASGHFVHVFVDRVSRRPAPIPEPIRHALERLATRH